MTKEKMTKLIVTAKLEGRRKRKTTEKITEFETCLKIIGIRKWYTVIKERKELRWTALEDMAHNEL